MYLLHENCMKVLNQDLSFPLKIILFFSILISSRLTSHQLGSRQRRIIVWIYIVRMLEKYSTFPSHPRINSLESWSREGSSAAPWQLLLFVCSEDLMLTVSPTTPTSIRSTVSSSSHPGPVPWTRRERSSRLSRPLVKL